MNVSMLQERLRVVDFVGLSSRYFLYSIVLGFFRAFWLIGITSGLFGSPPSDWIHTVKDLLEVLMIVYVSLGIFLLIEAGRRYLARQNEPTGPLILNVVGVVMVFIFTLRVDYVMSTDPPITAFSTWAKLLTDGIIQGGVYALIALGYTLVYGILLMINFAHGEVMMFGTYAGYLSMQYMTGGNTRSFEDGSTLVATFAIPLFIGIMFLPLEALIMAYANRHRMNFQSPDWLFTLFSSPVRFAVGFAVGYGAFVGLGGYAPHVYLLVITLVGVLFVMICAMGVSMSLAVVLERIAYRPLRRAPRLAPLISAIGASLFLQQVALRIFGPNRRPYPAPRLLNDPPNFEIDMGHLGILLISKVGLAIVITSVALMILLYVIIQRTKIGKAMRAVAQDKPTAALMGIDVDRIIVFTFMLGASLAAAAGVMLGLRGEKVDFKFGFTPGIKAFTAAVLGGIGSIPGAMFGGFFLGIVESLGPFMLGFDTKWQNAIAFSLLVLVLIFRPSGLLGAATDVKKV